MTLHRNILLPEARVLSEVLLKAPEMNGFTLIGGTALALQPGHRISLDASGSDDYKPCTDLPVQNKSRFKPA